MTDERGGLNTYGSMSGGGGPPPGITIRPDSSNPGTIGLLVNDPAPFDPATLTIGRIVWYRLESGPNAGQDRPAIVVRVWAPKDADGNELPLRAPYPINLVVFIDGENDFNAMTAGTMPIMWRTSVLYSADPKERTWRWPPRSLGGGYLLTPMTGSVTGATAP